jgi:hypothetical protein
VELTIAAALQVQKSLNEEVNHLRQLEQQNAWSYRSEREPDTKITPNFNFDDNHAQIRKLTRLYTKLGQSISRTNLEAQVKGLSENDLKELEGWY